MSALRITLRPGERIYVNGAVIRTERKTTLEFLNDVTFLLESHVMQAEDATSPLRQLYYTVQTLLIDPANAEPAWSFFDRAHRDTQRAYSNRDVIDGLDEVRDLVERERCFEALKRLRKLIPIEDEILAESPSSRPGPDRKCAARTLETAGEPA